MVELQEKIDDFEGQKKVYTDIISQTEMKKQELEKVDDQIKNKKQELDTLSKRNSMIEGGDNGDSNIQKMLE